MSEPLKKCGGCGERKPVVQFSISKKARDGRQSWCKLCSQSYHAARSGPSVPRGPRGPQKHRAARRQAILNAVRTYHLEKNHAEN